MKNPLPFLLSATGHYRGRGINHETQKFRGEFTLTPVLGGKAVQIHFKASGADRMVFHEELSTISLDANENPLLANLNTNMPGLVIHEFKGSKPELGAKEGFIFQFNDPENRQVFREEICLGFYANGDLSYRYSWGLPDGDFGFRSSVRLAPFTKKERPACIQHWSQNLDKDNSTYEGSDELLSYGARLGKITGLTKIGVHHEIMPPARRTSWPHAESLEDEFVYVLKGYPQVWIDGELYPLEPGDAVGFPSGTGIAHTFINNSNSEVHLLVLGETAKRENKIFYPLHPKRNEELKSSLWTDRPQRPLGSHDGLPDKFEA